MSETSAVEPGRSIMPERFNSTSAPRFDSPGTAAPPFQFARVCGLGECPWCHRNIEWRVGGLRRTEAGLTGSELYAVNLDGGVHVCS